MSAVLHGVLSKGLDADAVVIGPSPSLPDSTRFVWGRQPDYFLIAALLLS
jgi:hypothetical protein